MTADVANRSANMGMPYLRPGGSEAPYAGFLFQSVNAPARSLSEYCLSRVGFE
jgi:hypothetical protein